MTSAQSRKVAWLHRCCLLQCVDSKSNVAERSGPMAIGRKKYQLQATIQAAMNFMAI